MSYEVFHAGWWEHAILWPHVNTVTFNIGAGFSVYSDGFIIHMHQAAVCWTVLGILCNLWCSCSVHSLPVNPSCLRLPRVPALSPQTQGYGYILAGFTLPELLPGNFLQATSWGSCRTHLTYFWSFGVFILHCLIPCVFKTVSSYILHSILVILGGKVNPTPVTLLLPQMEV